MEYIRLCLTPILTLTPGKDTRLVFYALRTNPSYGRKFLLTTQQVCAILVEKSTSGMGDAYESAV
jgi:hypothetical protein